MLWRPEHLHEGWAALEYSSPFAQLALALNLNWLAILLYADAFVSPSGTGTTYTATTARMIYAMERSGSLPGILGRVHSRFGIPRPAMWFNLLVSFMFLFFFRGWGKLAAVISVATIITYLVVPVSVEVLRRTAPQSTPASARAGTEAAGTGGLRVRDTDAVLGALAAHGPDHAAVDPADAGISLLSSEARLARFQAKSARRLVADRLPRGGAWSCLGPAARSSRGTGTSATAGTSFASLSCRWRFFPGECAAAGVLRRSRQSKNRIDARWMAARVRVRASRRSPTNRRTSRRASISRLRSDLLMRVCER